MPLARQASTAIPRSHASLRILAVLLACTCPTIAQTPSAAPNVAASYPLATTTTQLASSIPSPIAGQPTTLSATITPGPGSSTPTGIYVPGPPTGAVTFADGPATLGTAPLLANTLTFAAASPQTITTSSATTSRTQSRPRDTPSPDNSSGFSSILADFNLDGVKDALILDPNSGTMHLFLGTAPGGNFLADNPIHTGATCFTGATVADLNGDGFPDIAYLCANTDNTASLFALYNHGDGTFAPPVALLTSLLTAGTQLGSGDLNHDGTIDLVVTGPITASATPTFGIQAFFGDGAGHFIAGPITSTAADPGTQLSVTDLNHDGAADLVFFSSSPLTYTTVVQPYQNDGAGNFTPTASIPACSCFTYTSKLLVTPLTANAAYPDILVALTDQQQAIVALNQRTTVIAFAPTLTQTLPNLADAVVGDLNGDGIADLAVFNGTTISVLNGNGAGLFAAQPSSPTFTASAANVSLVAAADFNQDGYADLLTIFPSAPFTSTINTFITTGTAVASLPATFATAATHPITSAYTGNVDLLGSTGALSLVVQSTQTYTAAFSVVAPPAAVPSTSATQAYAPGGTFSLIVTLAQATSASLGYRTPGGTVSVSENGVTLAAASPIPAGPGAGVATLAQFGSATTGLHPFTLAYTGDASYLPLTQTFLFTVTRATPVLTFPTPPTAVVGTPLSTIQLSFLAAAASVTSLPGTVTFTPNTGLVTAGPQTLAVTFTPTDITDYTPATATVVLNGTAVTLTALSTSTALLGDPAKTVTLTGTGFLANSVARANGSALTTTYVSPTTLSAILPASSFLTPQTLQITVFDPTQAQTSAALPFIVSPPPVGTITFTAPTTANAGDQPTIRFALTNPYPVALQALLTLTFSPIAGAVDDPAIQFLTGGRTFPFSLAAGQTASPNIQFQSGTVAGTIQVTLLLTAAGVNVTPASVVPLVITIPPAAPGLTSVTLTRNGRQLTVSSVGFSNTRTISQAAFHFTPAAGQQIQTQDIPLDVTSLFSGWYTQTVSDTYGSMFLYTQTFTLDEDASVVGQVTLTLSNGVGVSASGSSN